MKAFLDTQDYIIKLVEDDLTPGACPTARLYAYRVADQELGIARLFVGTTRNPDGIDLVVSHPIAFPPYRRADVTITLENAARIKQGHAVGTRYDGDNKIRIGLDMDIMRAS